MLISETVQDRTKVTITDE